MCLVDNDSGEGIVFIMAKHASTLAIYDFVLDSIGDHETDLVRHVSQELKLSRQAVNRHLHKLVAEGVLIAIGNTKSRRYKLKELALVNQSYRTQNLEEHVPWQTDIKPHLLDLPNNVKEICSYGFTEMLNNAINHSQSEMVTIELRRTQKLIAMRVYDFGIGIFNKIKIELNLDSELQAIHELSKGKLTTDPQRHTGEGIFFTSRMFDEFSILSGELFFSHRRPDNDWLIENRHNGTQGTMVNMVISSDSKTVYKSVFDEFASAENDYRFSKTHVPVKLMQYGAGNLVSRSQAKRVLSRFEIFEEVILDFTGIQMIGQGFADEVFRVFNIEHPNTKIIPINATSAVREMIKHALSNRGKGDEANGPLTRKPSALQKSLFRDEPTANEPNAIGENIAPPEVNVSWSE